MRYSDPSSSNRPRLALFLGALSLAFLQLAAALPSPSPAHARLVRRADVSGLDDGSRLNQSQVDGVEALLNKTADKSWEIGTHLQALLEFHYPSYSPFSSSSAWANPSSVSGAEKPTQVLTAVASILAAKPANQLQLVQDGSAADPASIGPFVALAYALTDGNSSTIVEGSGVTKAQAGEALQGQLRALTEGTPRSQSGAISHRVEDVELWSDFVYMVPPFLSSLSLLSSPPNSTLLQLAYDQIRLYRDALRDPSSGLWTHIWVEEGQGNGGDADGGVWATGNGWAASGMLRVLASIQNSGNSDVVDEFASQRADLAGWVREIVEGAWGMPLSNGLLHNYLNSTSTFADAASTALLISATYRLATLASRFPSALNSSAPSAESLAAAESAYLTLTSASHSHISTSGVLMPVVNPMSYGNQLANVKADGSGAVSPEGEAFVLLMESARRDFVEGGGLVSANASEVRQSSGAAGAGVGGWGRWAVLAVVVVAGAAVV
ncbi:hypothetical protein JCM8097_001386 [Rhodosporidiobolus ruineniae]